jgi:ammonium transporter Rh
LPIIQGLNMGGQLAGIGLTIAIAFIGGLITGKILPIMGRKAEAYEDSEEFLDAA